MSLFIRTNHFIFAKQSLSSSFLIKNYSKAVEGVEEFRELKIRPENFVMAKRPPRKVKTTTPRIEKMKEDQNWMNVWPAQRSFHPSSVPLPVRQGMLPHGPSPSKYGNLELMKIPNFLHLTPPAITRHCAALRKFCTDWPEGLDTDEECERHFPIEISTSDYLHSSPSIRDPLARVVTLKVKLSNLPLDEHAKDKMLRLVGDRYDKKTDILTIVTDRCPYRQQNADYAHYLLTALFFESWKVEDWESEKSECDMEKFVWDGSKSQQAISALKVWSSSNPINIEEADRLPDNALDSSQATYKKVVEEFRNIEESDESVRKYKEAAERLLLGKASTTPQISGQVA